MTSKYCIAALGNPGSEYENTRHNAGVILLDYLIKTFGAVSSGTKSKCMVWSASIRGTAVDFIRTTEYMNLSGPPVNEYIRRMKIPVDRLIVLHDEIDYPLGKVRLKHGGGSAGHNGLKSLFGAVGSQDFYRLRVGIGKDDGSVGNMRDPDFVLSVLSSDDMAKLDGILAAIPEIITLWIKGKINKAVEESSKIG